MKLLPNLLIVLGVCVGALGASGFHTPHETTADALVEREPYALALFVAGVVLMAVGGGLMRESRRPAAEGATESHAGKRAYVQEIGAIRDVVVELDEARATLDPGEARERIAHLLAEQYFDLTSRSEDLARLVGFSAYARVWEGVATAERLLNRSWSMITDGHAAEGLAELPLIRASIEQAAREMESA